MTIDATERLVKESDRELEQTVRAAERRSDARGVLARLIAVFDNQHNRREALALREGTEALSSRSRSAIDGSEEAASYHLTVPKRGTISRAE